MAFNASVNLGTVGKGITGQTVSISGCTGPSCASGCSSLATSQAVSSFPKTLTGIPDGTLSLFVKVDGGDCAGTNQCITIAGIPGATPTPTNTPTSTVGVTSTPTSTGTPTNTATPTITPTSTITATPTATQSDGPICYFTQTGTGIPLSGGGSSTSGLIKVTTGTINVWAKYNSAGSSSGTASFSLTIGGVTATGGFTITSPGQVGYTNSGGSNNLTYIVLTPGTYQYTLTKSDNLTSGNNVNIVYTTGGATDPAVATNIQPCLSEPPGPYLTLIDPTPTPTSTPAVVTFSQTSNSNTSNTPGSTGSTFNPTITVENGTATIRLSVTVQTGYQADTTLTISGGGSFSPSPAQGAGNTTFVEFTLGVGTYTNITWVVQAISDGTFTVATSTLTQV